LIRKSHELSPVILAKFVRLAKFADGFVVKTKKKKVAFPRRTWQINPVTRVKDSVMKYSRPRVKQDLQKHDR